MTVVAKNQLNRYKLFVSDKTITMNMIGPVEYRPNITLILCVSLLFIYDRLQKRTSSEE